ncbi:MAG: hypothetical protein V1779_01725 [bacterium]
MEIILKGFLFCCRQQTADRRREKGEGKREKGDGKGTKKRNTENV